MSSREANDNAPRAPGEAPAKVLGRDPVAPLPKRFYECAATTPSGTGYAVTLDNRAIKTPKKAQLIVPRKALADAIAAEWQAQGEHIDPTTMPLTRLANTTLDAVIPNLGSVRSDLVDFANSDALCYRASEPAGLSAHQAEVWDPLLAWADRTLGARFETRIGIVHAAQSAKTLAAIRRAFDSLSAWQITPLHVMTTITGSAVLALAVAKGGIDLGAAWTASHVDEDWQISTWGEDDEAVLRRERRWLEMEAAARMLETLS